MSLGSLLNCPMDPVAIMGVAILTWNRVLVRVELTSN